MDALKRTIRVKSSSSEFHEVQFILEEKKVRIFCHCQAGILQRMCKHKAGLIKGDLSLLVDETQEADLKLILAFPSFAKVKERFSKFDGELAELEKQIAVLTKREKATKDTFARELAMGVS